MFHILLQPRKNSAFTLVELIIVITILAILATISFVSFQGYTKNARDSVRLSSLKNIENGLLAFQIHTGNFPLPDNNINLLASGNIIGYQGYIGNTVGNLIQIQSIPLDPYDNRKYIYSTNASKTKYELLGFLENPQISLSFVSTTYADNTTSRIPYIKGDSIGILLDTSYMLPANNIDVISYTGSNLSAFFENNSVHGSISGTGGTLFILEKTMIAGGVKKNCYEYLNSNSSLLNKDGIYAINPSGGNILNVYCDMSTDGGGWTFVGMSTGASNSGTIILTNNSLGNFTDTNATSTVKLDTNNINNVLFSGKNTLRINNATDGKKRYIEYANNGQRLDFSAYKSYLISITEPSYGQKSPFFESHSNFRLFVGITKDLPLPTGCIASYERISYGYYIPAQGRYATRCLDSMESWGPYIWWSGGWGTPQMYNYKMYVK